MGWTYPWNVNGDYHFYCYKCNAPLEYLTPEEAILVVFIRRNKRGEMILTTKVLCRKCYDDLWEWLNKGE